MKNSEFKCTEIPSESFIPNDIDTKLKLHTDPDGKLSDNFILSTDAYKVTHHLLYPKQTEKVYSYLESRGGQFPNTLFFGLQIYLKKYFQGEKIQEWMVDEADKFCMKVFGHNYFNRTGFKRIVDVHGGHLPLDIKALPEGTVVPTGNVLMTIENTDEELGWLTNFAETLLFEPVWYGTTIASFGFELKKLVKSFVEITGEDTLGVNPFFLNDFGFRGVSSKESAGIGGAAHLVNFLGTDTLEGIRYAMHYYDTDVCGHSVAATEHSVVCMHGVEHELEAYRHFIDSVPQNAILSSVSDTYDYRHTVDVMIGQQLKEKIMNRDGGKFVVRPDSGDPVEITVWTLESLWKNFGGTTNERGYRQLDPHIGVIYGDNMDYDMITKVINAVTQNRFCVNNVVFGMGGGLLQKFNRDTQKFAIKASYGKVAGFGREISKSTMTDPTKASKAGRLKLVQDDKKFKTVKEGDAGRDLLESTFYNGNIIKEYTFDEVRETALRYFPKPQYRG